MVTVDGVNGGADIAWIASLLWGFQVQNVYELEPWSSLTWALNYQDSYANGKSAQTRWQTLGVGIDAIISTYREVPPIPCTLHPLDVSCYTDTAVESDGQSIQKPLAAQPFTNLNDLPNTFDPLEVSTDPNCFFYLAGVLPIPTIHPLECLGDYHISADYQTGSLLFDSVKNHTNSSLTQVIIQTTYNSSQYTGPINLILQRIDGGNEVDTSITNPQEALLGPSVPPSPTAVYTLKWVSGGPTGAAPTLILGGDANENLCGPCQLKPGNWSLTFLIEFTSGGGNPPVIKTLPASPVYSNDAILNGTVNPEGLETAVWFEWGTNVNLSPYQSTAQQSVPAGNTPVSITFDQSGLSSNETYYYRIAANNGGATQRDNPPVSFTTAAVLEAPVLSSPSNGSTGLTTAPTLTWSTVSGATSYRLLVATNPAALPTDPASSNCGIGCALIATTTGTTYTPTGGILSGSTTYYWEVSATGSGLNGNWSGIFSFTTSPSAGNDFSLQVTPNSQSVNGSGTVGYAISTTTISGMNQTIELGVGNLPTGVTALFTPNVITSGSTAIIGLTTSSSTPVGTYSITIAAIGSSTTHAATVALIVTNNTGTPGVSFSPPSLGFSNQTQYTTGPSQLVTYTNTGTAPLQVLAIVGDSNFVVQSPCINTLPAGTSCSFSVASDPSVTGPMTGTASLYFAGNGSPAVLPLRGYGVAPLPTTGTIQVNGTLNGIALPAGYSFSFTLTGPATYTAGGAYTFTVTPGTYALSFSGTPSWLTLAGITPAATQTVAAGGVMTYTMNFTAPNDFYGPFFGTPVGGTLTQIVPAGSPAVFSIGDPYPPAGNASTPLTLQVSGNPGSEGVSFNPQPMYSGGGSTLTISTNQGDQIGAYTLSLNATNSSGLSHPGENTSALVITASPSQPLQLASESSSAVQGNGASYIAPGAVSADGRYVVFGSSATNLGSNSFPGVFLRDVQAGTTTLISVSGAGAPADNNSGYGNISSSGRYVVFGSDADNLASGTIPGYQSIYVRDLQQSTTEREDIAADGTPENGSASQPTVSADGRFVVFVSNATNLVSGVPGNLQIYLRDRKTGQIRLVSVGMDGSPANDISTGPTLSADGRYVAYYSNATNLVSQTTGGIAEVYVYDAQAAQTVIASSASDGTPAGQWVLADYSPPAMSADGRFVSFVSNATNLIPGAIDYNGDFRVFLKDLRSQAISLVDTDANGTPLARGGTEPQISADGRFVAYMLYGQIFVRDLDSNRSVAISLAPNGTPGNNASGSSDAPNINPSGTVVAFDSTATNLVTNDTNSASDVFFSPNPLVQSPFAQSLAISPSPAPGGNEASGYLTLTGPAPQGGATVSLSCNNIAAVVPAFVVVPAGATTMTFGINTSLVSAETVMTIIASYNGGAAVGLLTLEPAPSLSVTPTSWDFGNEAVGTTGSAYTFTVSNTGTASLALNSINLASGRSFQVTSNTCGVTLAAGSSCTAAVAFSPKSAGQAADTLQISYGSPANIQSVLLYGNGTVPLASLSPPAINFGSQPIPSATPASVTLTNVGTAALSNISASIVGANTSDFQISGDGCSGQVLQPSSSCLITVTFSPQLAGVRNASLSVSDNAAGSPQLVTLTGTGVATTPPLTFSPAKLSWGNQALGSTSAAKKVTLTNKTGVVVTGISWTVIGIDPSDFQVVAHTCGATLAVKASCTIGVAFAPGAVGARLAVLSITDSASNSPQSVSLTGTGILPVTLTPTAEKFPATKVGVTSAAKTVTIKNNLPTFFTLSGTSFTGANPGDFAQSGTTCGGTLGAGLTCTVSIKFTPTAKGSRVAILNLSDSAITSPQTVALSGTGK
jgi:hypothetical protein